MSKPLVTVAPDATVYEAAKLMAVKSIGALVVVKTDNKPLGIITERDVINKVLSKGKDYKKSRVEEAMSTDLITLDINSSVLEATKIMTKHGFRRLLVMKDGKAKGIVTDKDLLQIYAT